MGDLFLTSGQYRLLLEASVVTLQILGLAFVIGVVLSLVVGVARLSETTWVRGVAFAFVEFARGISSIILLFIMAFAIPILLNIPQENKVVLAAIALGINMGGYGAEIIRGAIQSVPGGQSEAGVSLNLSPMQRLRYVILPQSMTVLLPPMGNLTIEILKGTALVSLVGVQDIMRMADIIRTQQRVAGLDADARLYLLLNVLVIYFVMAQVINGLFRLAEWWFAGKFVGGPTLTQDEVAELLPGAPPEVGR